LYSVEIISHLGERLSQVVSIESGEPTRADFSDRPLGRRSATRRGGYPDHLRSDGPEVGEVELVGVEGCELRSEVDGRSWEFVPTPPLETVPTATFNLPAQRTAVVSLPLNPRGEYPLSACTVTYELSTRQLITTFAPERRTSTTLGGMLRTGEFITGSRVLSEASQLLFYKYQDPPGAALGGLTLHRVGRLATRAGWVSNLARSFPWLPDGAILRAALDLQDPLASREGKALDALLEAAARRPMFTDALSLAMELLRRWPPGRDAERAARLAGLARYSAGADWDALNLTVATALVRSDRES
jgi:hypothetical protein